MSRRCFFKASARARAFSMRVVCFLAAVSSAIVAIFLASRAGSAPARATDSPPRSVSAAWPASSRVPAPGLVRRAGSRGNPAVTPGPLGLLAETEPSPADEEDLLSLLDAAVREPDPARRREMCAGVCVRWAGFDPPGAIALAGDLRLDPMLGALQANLVQQWAARDFPAALAWARRLPPGDARDDVYSRLVYERARIDPRSAVELLSGMRAGGSARAEAALTILYHWEQRDPETAGRWKASIAISGL